MSPTKNNCAINSGKKEEGSNQLVECTGPGLKGMATSS